MAGMKMPVCYVAEMFVDRISASKNYQKDKYTDGVHSITICTADRII